MEKVHFDTEFTGLHKDTTLISIGLIDEAGRTFYAELGDFDHRQVDEWIQENVINHLRFHGKEGKGWCNCSTQVAGEPTSKTEAYGNKEFVGHCLREWFKGYGGNEVQMVSDVAHYDMVLFIDLFGTAFDLPPGVNASCHDINQDIARFYNISEHDAFDESREMLAGMTEGAQKHDALWDAKVIRAINYIVN